MSFYSLSIEMIIARHDASHSVFFHKESQCNSVAGCVFSVCHEFEIQAKEQIEGVRERVSKMLLSISTEEFSEWRTIGWHSKIKYVKVHALMMPSLTGWRGVGGGVCVKNLLRPRHNLHCRLQLPRRLMRLPSASFWEFLLV